MNYCLCTCVNDAFVEGAQVMLYSFLKNNEWFEGDIVILTGAEEENWPMHLSAENREKLSNIYHKVKFVNTSFGEFSSVVNDIKTFAIAGLEPLLYKLPLFSLEEYDRIAFIDSDMLVVSDIKDFFFNEDRDFSACVDRIVGEKKDWEERNKQYLNMGFFVVGKPLISKSVYADILATSSIFDLSKKAEWNPFGGKFVDQDILNTYLIDKKVSIAPTVYNTDKEVVDKVGEIGDVKIIHYLGRPKPWSGTCKGYSKELWDSYKQDYNEWLSYYRLRWGEIRRNYPKNYGDKDKYVVCTCAKNENQYIREWVEHYLKLGFDKLFIFDNNDDASLCDVLSDYIEKGQVERFDCHKMTLFQDGVYKMFLEEGNFKWCGFFDCDEFLELCVYDNIKDYLAEKEDDCIAFNWLMFNSNGQLRESSAPLYERFTLPRLPICHIYNSFLKCIVRGGHLKYRSAVSCGGHLPTCNNTVTYNMGGYYRMSTIPKYFQSSLPLRYKEGYIRHFYTKSFDEWVKKASRGWPDRKGTLPYHRYFLMDSTETLTKEDYKNNLFIDSATFERLSESVFSYMKDHDIMQLYNDSGILYAFISRLMNIMAQMSGKTFIIRGEFIDDMAYTLLFECGFITGNNVIFVKNDDEMWRAFKRYRGANDDKLFEVKI